MLLTVMLEWPCPLLGHSGLAELSKWTLFFNICRSAFLVGLLEKSQVHLGDSLYFCNSEALEVEIYSGNKKTRCHRTENKAPIITI